MVKTKQGLDMFTVAPGVFGLKDTFVNMYMIADEDDVDKWILVDAGLKWSASKIKKMAAMIFGENSKPKCIVLTHGHFDHVGSVRSLAEEWNVPVYAHYLEQPYLNGQSSYPPPDPSVGGGMMASMSWMYPKGPINICDRLLLLDDDGSVPYLSDWKFIHTPGHSPGHISLFRESDRVLISGDAFVTTKAESAIAVFNDKKEISGPPKYFTMDWEAAARSVQRLANLEPEIIATGHGKPMAGPTVLDELHALVREFAKKAKPSHGRYIDEPAIANESGVIYVPPKPGMRTSTMLIYSAVAIGLLVLGARYINQKNNRRRELQSEL
jgi:glyoxylase-like metal-dependent hydrolase (beta-lactamase superfamily II)